MDLLSPTHPLSPARPLHAGPPGDWGGELQRLPTGFQRIYNGKHKPGAFTCITAGSLHRAVTAPWAFSHVLALTCLKRAL